MLDEMIEDKIIKISDQDIYPADGQIARLNAILAKWQRKPISIQERAISFELGQGQNTEALDSLMAKMGITELQAKIQQAMEKIQSFLFSLMTKVVGIFFQLI